MISIDTNIVVRFLVADDRAQAERAKRLIETEAIFLPTSVLLETEWVLRTAYRFSRRAVCDRLRAFLDLPHVSAQDVEAARLALDWADAGMDFADALHLASSIACAAFATFDRALVKAAAGTDAPPVRAP